MHGRFDFWSVASRQIFSVASLVMILTLSNFGVLSGVSQLLPSYYKIKFN